MTIYKAGTLIEAYRARAKSEDINDLSGRTGMPYLTKAIAQNIIQELELKNDDVLVDIGCGDGSLLWMAAEAGVNPWLGRLIGVLPTNEEVRRVQGHFLERDFAKGGLQVTRGLSHHTVFPDVFATKVVCNGVFLLLDNEELVDQSLLEIYRITKPGGTVFIGELPDADESITDQASISLNDMLLVRITKVLVRYGPLEIFRRLVKRVYAVFSNELVIIAPKAPFWMEPDRFIKKMDDLGFSLIKYYSCETNAPTKEVPLPHRLNALRWNYIAIRK